MEMTCAILAGGQSTRMGRDKATIEAGGKNLAAFVFDKVREVFGGVMVISRHHDRIEGVQAPIYKDMFPYRSPVVGIATALLHAETEYVFVVACDMPFISRKVLEFMIGEARGEDIVIPRTKAGYEPLHAIYRRSCLAPMLYLMEKEKLGVINVLPYVSAKILEDESVFSVDGHSIFTNINTVDDLKMVASE